MSYIKLQVLFTMTFMLTSSRVTFTKSLPLSAVQPRNSHQVVEMQQTRSLQELIPDAVEALKSSDEWFRRDGDSFTVAEVPGSLVSSLDAKKSATGESSEESPPVDREMAKTKASTISRSKRAAQPRLYDILALSDAEATKIDEDIDTPYPIMERPTAQQGVFRPMVRTVRDNSDNPRRFPSHISQKRCGNCNKTRCAGEGGICKQIYHQTDILQGYYSAIRGETVYRMESINVPVACTCYKN